MHLYKGFDAWLRLILFHVWAKITILNNNVYVTEMQKLLTNHYVVSALHMSWLSKRWPLYPCFTFLHHILQCLLKGFFMLHHCIQHQLSFKCGPCIEH